MSNLSLVGIFLIIPLQIHCIWPPPYEIKLNDVETFVISEFSEGDNLIDDEDEMIKVDNFNNEEEKYRRIHQLVDRHNKNEMNNKNHKKIVRKIKESNLDLEDAIPWEGGFVDKNGNFVDFDNERVYFLNENAKSLIDSKINQKREQNEPKAEDKEVNYDYNNLKAEYNEEMKKAEKQKNLLNYTDVKEDESLEDALETMVEFKEATNCTEEEKKGIGLAALKCIAKEVTTSKSNNSILNLTEKILRITLIWLCVYVFIAIPCWCSRGWCCCCCCCCKCCRPRETIDDAKQFFINNPVGVFHTEEGEKLQYQPTNYEIYAQKRLEKALFSL